MSQGKQGDGGFGRVGGLGPVFDDGFGRTDSWTKNETAPSSQAEDSINAFGRLGGVGTGGGGLGIDVFPRTGASSEDGGFGRLGMVGTHVEPFGRTSAGSGASSDGGRCGGDVFGRTTAGGTGDVSEGVAGSGVALAGRNTCGHRADGANGFEKLGRGVAGTDGSEIVGRAGDESSSGPDDSGAGISPTRHGYSRSSISGLDCLQEEEEEEEDDLYEVGGA